MRNGSQVTALCHSADLWPLSGILLSVHLVEFKFAITYYLFMTINDAALEAWTWCADTMEARRRAEQHILLLTIIGYFR